MVSAQFALEIESALFPVKLYKLASSEEVLSIFWSREGQAVKIDIDKLSEECFRPEIFKVTDHKSVFRQLSYYGFGRYKRNDNIFEFWHPQFSHGHFNDVKEIRRSGKKNRNPVRARDSRPPFEPDNVENCKETKPNRIRVKKEKVEESVEDSKPPFDPDYEVIIKSNRTRVKKEKVTEQPPVSKSVFLDENNETKTTTPRRIKKEKVDETLLIYSYCWESLPRKCKNKKKPVYTEYFETPTEVPSPRPSRGRKRQPASGKKAKEYSNQPSTTGKDLNLWKKILENESKSSLRCRCTKKPREATDIKKQTKRKSTRRRRSRRTFGRRKRNGPSYHATQQMKKMANNDHNYTIKIISEQTPFIFDEQSKAVIPENYISTGKQPDLAVLTTPSLNAELERLSRQQLNSKIRVATSGFKCKSEYPDTVFLPESNLLGNHFRANGALLNHRVEDDTRISPYKHNNNALLNQLSVNGQSEVQQYKGHNITSKCGCQNSGCSEQNYFSPKTVLNGQWNLIDQVKANHTNDSSVNDVDSHLQYRQRNLNDQVERNQTNHSFAKTANNDLEYRRCQLKDQAETNQTNDFSVNAVKNDLQYGRWQLNDQVQASQTNDSSVNAVNSEPEYRRWYLKDQIQANQTNDSSVNAVNSDPEFPRWHLNDQVQANQTYDSSVNTVKSNLENRQRNFNDQFETFQIEPSVSSVNSNLDYLYQWLKNEQLQGQLSEAVQNTSYDSMSLVNQKWASTQNSKFPVEDISTHNLQVIGTATAETDFLGDATGKDNSFKHPKQTLTEIYSNTPNHFVLGRDTVWRAVSSTSSDLSNGISTNSGNGCTNSSDCIQATNLDSQQLHLKQNFDSENQPFNETTHSKSSVKKHRVNPTGSTRSVTVAKEYGNGMVNGYSSVQSSTSLPAHTSSYVTVPNTNSDNVAEDSSMPFATTPQDIPAKTDVYAASTQNTFRDIMWCQPRISDQDASVNFKAMNVPNECSADVSYSERVEHQHSLFNNGEVSLWDMFESPDPKVRECAYDAAVLDVELALREHCPRM